MNASPTPSLPPHIGGRILERSDTVLWTLSPGGIVLHNFARRVFLELDEIGYQTWGFLDGARPVDEVVARVCVDSAPGNGTVVRSIEPKVKQIVATLLEHGFVAERPRR